MTLLGERSGGRSVTIFDRVFSKAGDLFQFIKPVVVLVILWELVAQFELIPQQALPHVYTVADALVRLTMDGTLLGPTRLTLIRAISALLLSTVIGISIGVLMARFRAVEWFFDPLISIGFPIPKVTFVPIYLLWFGFGTLPTVLLATTAAVFPVIIATYNGAKGVNREYIWSVRSMGVSKFATTWKVVLPAALPEIFNGLQIAVFLSFILTLVTEMVTSGGGLGYQLVFSVRFHRTAEALSFLFVAIALGVATDRLFRVLRTRTLDWSE